MLIGEEIYTVGQHQFLMPNSMDNSNMISDLTKNFIQLLRFQFKNCHFWVYFSDSPYKKDITSECSNSDTIRSTEMLCTSLESCECHLSKNVHHIYVFLVSSELGCVQHRHTHQQRKEIETIKSILNQNFIIIQSSLYMNNHWGY